jgi:hypothetical protein
LRQAQQRRAAACDSGAVVRSSTRGQLGPQLAASSDGMRRSSMRQPWPEARVTVWPEWHWRWGSAGAGEGNGENDPDGWAPGGGD